VVAAVLRGSDSGGADGQRQAFAGAWLEPMCGTATSTMCHIAGVVRREAHHPGAHGLFGPAVQLRCRTQQRLDALPPAPSPHAKRRAPAGGSCCGRLHLRLRVGVCRGTLRGQRFEWGGCCSSKCRSITTCSPRSPAIRPSARRPVCRAPPPRRRREIIIFKIRHRVGGHSSLFPTDPDYLHSSLYVVVNPVKRAVKVWHRAWHGCLE
jgi:hypothetical protein